MSGGLPPGWELATIGDVTIYVQRGKSPKYVERSELPVVNQKCIRWDEIQAEHLKFVDPVQWEKWGPERTLQPGDVLWNSTGTGTIGRAALFEGLDGFDRVVADSHVTVVRSGGYEPRLLHAWIKGPTVQSKIEDMQTGTTNQVELSKAEVVAAGIPVPPLNEQRRIVDKIDTLFAHSKKAKESLDRIPALLDKLKKSILAAAFRGDLTRDWREQNPDVEPASVLLERIRAVRAKPWEGQELETARPKLPQSWAFTRFGDLFDLKGGSQPPKSTFKPVPGPGLIRLLQIRDFATEKYPAYIEDNPKWPKCEDDDVLVARYGASLGRVLSGRAGAYNVALTRVLFPKELLDARFVFWLLKSDWFQRPLFLVSRSAQNGFNKGEVFPRPIVLPPLAEQAEIARQLDSAVSHADRLLKEVSAQSLRLGKLEQATLAKAFRGELVPQDPNDEPASALLERIRAEREATEATKPKRGGRKKRAS